MKRKKHTLLIVSVEEMNSSLEIRMISLEIHIFHEIDTRIETQKHEKRRIAIHHDERRHLKDALYVIKKNLDQRII
jgi:hypothetical protein